MDKPKAVIIGAGFTGCATAHDLALRGFDVTVVERGPIANGTSGRTHGLLHSGGRYAVDDQESAVECIEENLLLRGLVAECLEQNGGLFVALDESDLEYARRWVQSCERCNIPVEQVDVKQALAWEPNLTSKILAAYTVPDATFDPLRLALTFAATAQTNGARFRLFTEVEGLIERNGAIRGVRCQERTTGKSSELYADCVINATGAWAGKIAQMAGDATIVVKPTPGVMVAYDQRLCNRVINRLNEPGDGDIIVPQRRMVVIGTTSFEVDEVDYIPVFEDQVQMMRECAIQLIPAVAATRQRGAFMAARPLIGSSASGRSIARTFKCFDHQETHGIGGLVTITGGKATTLRAMAEKTADTVCAKLGITAPCQTREYPLRSYREFRGSDAYQ
ncbi:MAG: FAD-dependent oxidoreductase [Anaerolineae bacterium]|nr:FAD-dependent oxidoreductase [Anaerolineae bacterium]